eukprot:c20026_g1_i1 orf=140-850(+)
MGLIKLAVADAAITFLWVVYIAFMRPTTDLIVSAMDLQGYEFHISMGLLALNIFLFSWLGGVLGGAFWNPTSVLAFYAVGLSSDTLFSLGVRYPAQAAGAVGGLLAAKELVPPSYKELLRGPRLMVDLSKGILAEFILTFIIIFAVLFAIFKGPKSRFFKNLIIILATIAVVLLGATYTGPSLNPAHAFAWAYVNDNHYNSEHLLVFWLAPLAGTLIATKTFQLVFPKGRPKEKAA